MSIFTSSIKLLQHADIVSKILLFLLLISSVAVFIFFLYALVTLLYKMQGIKKLIRTQHDLAYQPKKNKNSDHIAEIISTVVAKKQDEEVLFYLLSDYIYYENKIKLFFSLAIAIAPLLGLFGTVWGIINVFLAMQGNFDIAVIAPGIAEALITTLGGLIVAIPAVLFYHVINFYIKKYYELSHLYYLYYRGKESEK